MKSGFVALIGRSNVGKSTLLNSLIGTKVAITTPKPQTTRRPIHGVMTIEDAQAVFIDTAGIMQKAKDQLTKQLHDWTKQSMKDVDMLIYVVDATRMIGDEEKIVLKMVKSADKPTLLVINKIDSRKSREYIDFYRDLFEQENFTGMIEVSAKNGSNVDALRRWIIDHLPEGEFMYPDLEPTNLNSYEMIAEIIREKLFLRLRQEVPYSTHVKVLEIFEKDDKHIEIDALIETTDDRYKGMIIGKAGRGVNEIKRSAIKELQTISDKRIKLNLQVEVNPHWITQFAED